MEREIKFQFIVSNNGKIFITKPFTLEYITSFGTTDEDIIISLESKCTSTSCNTESQNFCDCGSDFDSAEIIGQRQYTELKDKNGKEIYEGDIVKPKSYHPISKVFWMNGSWKVKGRMGKIGFGSWAKTTEVIGNIYENPELLEK